jgi:hypothetical protein
MEYSKMNTRHLLSEYRKKKLEYFALQNELSYVEPDAEELKVLARDIQELKNELKWQKEDLQHQNQLLVQ